MATTWYEPTGGTDGAALAAGNYTPAVTGVSVTGGTLTLRTSGGVFGTRRHIQEVGTSGTTGQAGRYVSFTASDQVAAAIEFVIVALPSAETSIMSFTAQSKRKTGVSLTALGELSVYDMAATRRWDGTAVKSAALPVGVPLSLSLYVVRSATAGTYRVAVHNLATGALIVDSGTQTGINTGDVSISAVWAGIKAGSNAAGGEIETAGIAIDPAATKLIDPRIPVVTPPTAVATMTGRYVLIDATASAPGSGGTITHAISPTTGVITQAAGKFLVPAPTVDTTYTVTVTETPSGRSKTVDVVVPAATVNGPTQRRSFYDGTAWIG